MKSSKNDIFQCVVDTIVADTGLDGSDWNMGSNLTEDLLLDSLTLFEIAVDLEDIYEIQMDDEALDAIQTIGDIVDYISREVD